MQKTATRSGEYFLDHDSSDNWYLVPVRRRGEWIAFLALPEDNEHSWEVPSWAIALDGGPTTIVKFTNPQFARRAA